MEKPSVPKLLRHTRGCRRLVSVDIDDVREICSIVWVDSFARAREMCSATKDEVRGSVWSLWLCPRHPQSAWTRRERYTVPWTASNTSQYSGSGRGSQPPEGGMLLRIPGRVLLPGHAEVKEHAESIPVLSDPNDPSEAKIHSFEGLWLTSGLVMLPKRRTFTPLDGSIVSVLR